MSLALMTYIHCAFTRHPVNCLKHLMTEQHGWPRDGIVRVEVIRNAASNYSLMDSYQKEFAGDFYDESFTTVHTGSRG